MSAETYRRLLSDLFARRRFGIELGTERVAQVLARLPSPGVAVRVAGTNGKGSTSAMLAAALEKAGLRVGLFTSPHLCRFTERFRIGGAEITQVQLCQAADAVAAAGGAELTFFEFATALAVASFSRAGADVSIFEVGLGGRLDATRAIDAQVVGLTTVGLDHQAILGNDLETIAAEKAGACHPGRPGVVATSVTSELLVKKARAVGAEPVSVAAPYDGPLRLLGAHQLANAGLALAIADALAHGGWIPRRVREWRAGISSAIFPGRLETIGGRPRVVLDVAHNEQSVRSLVEAKGSWGSGHVVTVFGVSSDKDIESVATSVVKVSDEVLVVSSQHSRAMAAADLALHVPGAVVCSTVAEAVIEAQARAGHDGTVLVCGSVFVVGEARAVLTGEAVDPPFITEP